MRFIFFLIATVAAFPAIATVTIDYKMNRIHGLFDFSMALAGESHHAPGLSKTFNDSRYNNPKNSEVLIKLKSLRDDLDKGIEFDRPVPSRASGFNVRQFINIQSIFAEDLQDLKLRTLGILPMVKHQFFFEVCHKSNQSMKN